jgi:diguanylate cyclase (GGDEF)-like protein/putative nucleotidyltransferase with HDIG domain
VAFRFMTSNRLSGWARLYVTAVALLGLATIAQSARELYVHPVGWNWLILAVLTLISGSATVKLPSVPATISISETFVFTSVLLFGAAAGTLTVTLDALVISLWLAWRGHPFYRIAFNVCALPAALWVGAQLYFLIGDVPPLHYLANSGQSIEITRLVTPLIVFTVVYFTLNSWLIAFAISLEKGLPAFKIWKDNFAWLSLNYFGGASVAALLVTYTRNIDYVYLIFVLPLLAILYFTFSMSLGRVEDANRHLSQLNKLYMSTIETLAMAIDAKDQITHGHIRRVQHYAVELARQLGVTDAASISAIEAASLLHDMGKLAVPEYILNKPGKLTPTEFEKMKLHASVGADILSAIDFPYPVVPIVRHHHENWDGSGYPDGLKGSQIPIGARILSVVDCFDALTSDRPYRPRLSDADALRVLMERRGMMYDPLIVDTFVRVHAEISPKNAELGTTKEGLSAITRGIIDSGEVESPARLHDIAASTEEMLVLYELAQGLTAHVELSDAADVISKHLRRIVPASTVVFYTYDAHSDDLIAAHASGENAPHFTGLRIPRGQRLTGWVAANKQTILNSDPVLDLGEAARSLRPRLRSCLSSPLTIGPSLVGVLSVYSTDRNAFTEDHRRILEVISRQVSQAVKNASEFEHDRAENFHDQLTGLPNLQHLERFVAAEMATASGRNALSIVFVDVDSLSSINRRFGWSTGDQILAFVAESIRRVLRGADVLFRYGNDEFVVLLAQTERPVAETIAARISERVRTHSASLQIAEIAEVRLRLGVATAPEDGTDLEALVRAARQRERHTSEMEKRPPSVH